MKKIPVIIEFFRDSTHEGAEEPSSEMHFFVFLWLNGHVDEPTARGQPKIDPPEEKRKFQN